MVNASSPETELTELRERIRRRLAAHADDDAKSADVRSIEPLAGGACQENWRVTIGDDALVLRSDATTSLAGSLDRNREYDVMHAAAMAGVKTPSPRWRMQGLVRDEAWSYFVPFLPGEAIGRKIVNAPEDARAGLVKELAEQAAKIHAITPETHPTLLPRSQMSPLVPASSPQTEALAWLREALDKRKSKRPATELALSWLSRNRPPETAVTMVHGDYRVGNFLVTPQGLTAVLDWEFAHWGSPDEDLAWLCVRDWRFGKIALPVGGIGMRSDFLRVYEAASGRKVNPASLRWWEIYGNCRWAVGTAEQAERYTVHGKRDVELAAIGRRGAEMEWEALRLIDVASPIDSARESSFPPRASSMPPPMRP